MNKNLTLISPIAKVTSVSETKQDKNGNDYRTLRLSTMATVMETHGGIEIPVKTAVRGISLNQWKESYLDGAQEPFYDAKVGEHIAVEVWNARNLEPYDLVNNTTGEVTKQTTHTFAVQRGRNPEKALNSDGKFFAKSEIEETVVKTNSFIED